MEEKVAELNKRIDNNQKIIVELIRDLEEEKEKTKSIHNNSKVVQFTTPQQDNAGNLQKSSKSKSRETITFPVIVDEPSEEESSGLSSSKNFRKSRNSLEGVNRPTKSKTFISSNSKIKGRDKRKQN